MDQFSEIQKNETLKSSLQSLSGKFGTTDRRVDGTLISNDEGYQEIRPQLLEHLSETQEGIGIFIGSGGALSMLPDLPITMALMCDMNPAVLELNALFQDLILASDSPEEVFKQLADPTFRSQHTILSDIDTLFQDIDIVNSFLKKESEQYGQYHWSHKERFPLVQEALKRKPMINIAVDITNPDFGRALKQIAINYQLDISFANFTNVHQWIKIANEESKPKKILNFSPLRWLKPKTMDFILQWPLQPETPILYSSHKNRLVGDFPKMYLTKSTNEYINNADE